MTDFTITEDFPKSEIEFDERFSNPKACYDYLFKQKWPNGFGYNSFEKDPMQLSSSSIFI